MNTPSWIGCMKLMNAAKAKMISKIGSILQTANTKFLKVMVCIFSKLIQNVRRNWHGVSHLSSYHNQRIQWLHKCCQVLHSTVEWICQWSGGIFWWNIVASTSCKVRSTIYGIANVILEKSFSWHLWNMLFIRNSILEHVSINKIDLGYRVTYNHLMIVHTCQFIIATSLFY